MLPLPAAGAGATGDTAMSSIQLIEQCATRLRGIVEALNNIHDTSPHRWSTDLDDVHSSAESLLALIKDQAPTQAAQGLAGAAPAQPSPAQAEQPTADDYEEVLADHRRLVREMDVLLNGEDGAAQQASLCDLVAQVRTLRLVHDNNVPTDNLGQSLLMLEFSLMFALCNFQHAGSRNDVKKAQTRLQEVLRFLSGKAKGFHLNTTELGYCAENPDVLRALAYEHDARAAAAEAIDLSGAVNTHEARAAVLRAEAKRIEDEL